MEYLKNYGILDDVDEMLKMKEAISTLEATVSVKSRAGCHKLMADHTLSVNRYACLVQRKEGVSGGNRIYFECNDKRCHENCQFQIQFNKSR
jgi:hypothetical protein